MRHNPSAKSAFASFAIAASVCAIASSPALAKEKAAVHSDFSCSAEQIVANKELARLFDMKRDPKVAYDHMAPDYIQHNPMAKRIGDVNGVSGRDEFKLLLDLKDKGIGGPPPQMPGQPPEDTYHYVMANCDHVFLLKKSYQADPQHPGQFYEAFDFDLWRVENGKLVEHWDGARIPNPAPPIISKPVSELMKDGPKGPPPGAPPAPGQTPPAGAPPSQSTP